MSTRPSHLQMEMLVEFLEKNPGIAKGHLRSAQARRLTKQKWAEITLSLNCLGGATKDAKSWAKRNASQSRTGGGIDSLPSLTDFKERLVSVMGGPSFAEGDQQLSVPLITFTEPEGSMAQSSIVTEVLGFDNPLPSTSQAVTSPISQPTTQSSKNWSDHRNLNYFQQL